MDNKILSFDNGVHCLQQGGLIIYPTETFFAVGCSIKSSQGLKRLYEVKNRPQKRPIPVLAASMEQVESIATLNPIERKLAQQFWPAALTIICAAKSCVPSIVTADSGWVAVRISPHPVATTLTKNLDDVLVCSSANLSGQQPVIDYNELSQELVKGVDGIVLGEPRPKGLLASTLVQVLDDNKIVIRRHGAVPEEDLISHGWLIVE